MNFYDKINRVFREMISIFDLIFERNLFLFREYFRNQFCLLFSDLYSIETEIDLSVFHLFCVLFIQSKTTFNYFLFLIL